MYVLLYAVIPLLLLLFFVLTRKKESVKIEADINRPYHAITIHPCKNACDCAKRIEGKRVLSSEFVTMKLKECARPNCDCTFEHFDDRRTGLDRRNFGDQVSPILADQRKQPLGRRIIDVHNKARINTNVRDLRPHQPEVREFGSIVAAEKES